MIWLNPLALVGIAAVAAPIVIHILVQRRAEHFAFPTLRFLRPTRLAAIRRHVLEDLGLLVVRAAIVAAAAVALAGPLLVTSARRTAWNARIARAIVVAGSPVRAAPVAPIAETTIETSDLRDGIARAVAWLETASPAKRELAVVSPFVLGSIARDDLRDVPPDVGIRLERSSQPPATRSFAATPILIADLVSRTVRQRDRTIVLSGPSTAVRDSAEKSASAPIEIVGPADVTRTAEATLKAVLSQGVPAPAPGRSARVTFATELPAAAPTMLSPPPWIADAIARVTTDAGRPGGTSTIASTDGSRLVVTTTLAPEAMRTALLFRSIFDVLQTSDFRLQTFEVVTVPDADLRAWERPAGDARPPTARTIDRDDRRWWWAAVLVLLGLEALLRRARSAQASEMELSNVA